MPRYHAVVTQSFPEATEHGELTEVFPDVFVVRGTLPMGASRGGTPRVITRTMTIVRVGGELVVFNSIRLTADGERALQALGPVRHVVKLGAFHGIDDPYYVDRYGATLWAQAGARHKRALVHEHEYSEGYPPAGLAAATVFEFAMTRLPEACVLLPEHGGILLSCDSVQNVATLDGCVGVEHIFTKEAGFLRPAGIGKFWRDGMAKDDGPTLMHDYRRLLELDFKHALTGHGPPLIDTARADLRATVQFVFGLRGV